MGGTLKSWAVPKGPSYNPAERRLAVQTEDHPIEYLTFEGQIPEGNYGAGDMAVWDTGTYSLFEGTDPEREHAKGMLKLTFHGERMHGNFALIKMPKGNDDDPWLLIKEKDDDADPNWTLDQVLPGTSRKSREHLEPDAKIPGAKSASMPQSIDPMLATLVDEPFSDPEWLYELKWDGFRALCFIDDGDARLVSRNQIDLGGRYPSLMEVPGQIRGTQAILDGELVALDEHGVPRFQLLQPKWKGKNDQLGEQIPKQIVYYGFDLIYYNGMDLTGAKLTDRKALLQQVLRTTDTLRFSDHVIGKGKELFEQARSLGLEGVMAKHSASAYVQKRSNQWLKMKVTREADVVVCGYTEPRNNRKYIGALVGGVYLDGELISVGHIGAGSSVATIKILYDLLHPLETEQSAFKKAPHTNEPVHWVKPKLVCQVKFTEWTSDHQMRHPIYLGIREDKKPSDCLLEDQLPAQREVRKVDRSMDTKPAATDKRTGKEAPVDVQEALKSGSSLENAKAKVDSDIVSVTHLNKVLWPEEAYTKRNLMRYYAQVADTLLPHIKDRPLILKRYPNGIKSSFFYQHNVEDAPDFVKIYQRQEHGETNCYAVCENTATLLYLVNLGMIAVNPFHSRTRNMEHPDWIAFDLDPEGVPYSAVCQVAATTRDILKSVGLESYAKTSGSSGMHIYVPLDPIYTYEQVLGFANFIGAMVEKAQPKLVTTERTIKKRPENSIYFDCYQNSEGKTIAGPYAVREKPGATVATPLSWDEVEGTVELLDFTIESVPDRIKEKGDLFAPVLANKQSLGKALKLVQGELAKMKGSSK
jgi:bifunctional non-homologous end joining protein LigD